MSTKSIAAVLALAGLMAAQAPYQTTEYLGGEFEQIDGWSSNSLTNEATIEQASVDGMTTSGALTLRPAPGHLLGLWRWTGTIAHNVQVPAGIRTIARVDFAIMRGTAATFSDPRFEVLVTNGAQRTMSLHRPDISIDYAPGTWIRGSAMADVTNTGITPAAAHVAIQAQLFDPTMVLRVDHVRVFTSQEPRGQVDAGAARPGELLVARAMGMDVSTSGVPIGMPLMLASAPGSLLVVPGLSGALGLEPSGLVVLQTTFGGYDRHLEAQLQVPAVPGLVGMRLALQAAQLGAAPYLGEPRVVPVDGGL